MRSVLAPLELEGLCTQKVESLASFFLRLAAVHQVTPAQLAKVVCNDSAYLQTDLGVTLNGTGVYPVMLCSHSTQTSVLVQRLEKLTGAQHLTCGTLLAFSGVLCGNQCGALVCRRRWCPQCYAASSANFAEPLAWWLPLVRRCDDHRADLEDRCSYCGAFQRPWQIGDARRYCCKCGHPLWHGWTAPREWTPWEKWCHARAMDLLAYAATPGSPTIEADALKMFVAALPRGTVAARNRLGVALHNLTKGWKRRPEPRARLETIFRIAALWGTTPLNILLSPAEAAAPALFHSRVGIPQPELRPHHSKEALAKCEQRFRALLALPPQVLLPSPKRICVECNVNDGTFRRYFMDLWTAYLSKRKARRDIQKWEAISAATSYANHLLQQLSGTGQRLHLKKATSRMMTDIHVPKAVARSALRCVLTRVRVERDAVKQAQQTTPAT